jgi:hypothetical protein
MGTQYTRGFMKIARFIVSLEDLLFRLALPWAGFSFAFLEPNVRRVVGGLVILLLLVAQTSYMSWFPSFATKILAAIRILFPLGIIAYTLYVVDWTRLNKFMHGVANLYASAYNESFNVSCK